MCKPALFYLVCVCWLWTTKASAQPAAELGALAKLPVREITVFKDGHALVLHEGRMPTDADGNVAMDYLPTPILGTFWPYSADKSVKLSAVIASPRRVKIERTALNLHDLLEANPDVNAHITEINGKSYAAHIIGIPERSSQELQKTGPPDSTEKLPEKANVILLKTASGTAVLPLDRVQSVSFDGSYKHTVTKEEFRNLLTLKLDWPGGRPARNADVGMMYLEKGVRWIPAYKVQLDGKGTATLALEATLINDMTDLTDVTANLVIGVPTFFFKDSQDPIGLQQAVAQLSPYFQNGSQTNYALSNAIMGQVGGFGGGAQGLPGPAGPAGAAESAGPAVTDSGRSEDLFVFTVKHVSLKRGQRMVLPIVETTLKYRDLYTVDISFAPPAEIRNNPNFNNNLNEQQRQVIRLINAPKAVHKIRLTNDSKYPLTTAPALILSEGKVQAQAMMTYTAIGGEVDLELTTAVDIKVKKSDRETKRTPNAANWQNQSFGRIDLAGTVSITNYRNQPVDLEVTRNVFGNVDSVDHDGQTHMLNVFEDDDVRDNSAYPVWWGWYSWPYWWNHFNGIAGIHWKFTLDPGKSIDLGYTWDYYWQ